MRGGPWSPRACRRSGAAPRGRWPRARRAPRRGRRPARACNGGPLLLLPVELRVALLDEGVPRLLRVGRGVELEREALLEPVAVLRIEHLDPVQRPLREA